RAQLERAREPFAAARGAIRGEVERIDAADALEGQPLLRGEPGMLLDVAEAERMRAARQQARGDERRNVLHRDRTVGDTALRAFDFDEGLEPVETTRAVAADIHLDAGRERLLLDAPRGRLCAERERAGIARNPDRDAHSFAFASASRSASRRSGVTRP